MVFKKKNLVEDFTIALSKMEAVEFLGVCKILNVKLTKDNNEPRPFKEMLFDVISKFSELNRKQKREMVKLIQSVNKNR